MTRAGRDRDDMRATTGGMRDAHANGGRPNHYGMGRGGVHAGSAAPYPPAYAQTQGAPVAPDPYAQGTQPHYAPAAAPYPYPTAAQYVPPATSIPQEEPKKKRRAAFWIGLAIALICIALAVLLVLNMLGIFGGKTKRQGSAGQLEGKTEEEIRAELDRVVDEGMFNISIAANVMMERGDAPAELRIENVPGNRYLMKVDIVRDDTGERIYETDLIEPNHHIQADTLDVSLPKGTYECTAVFSAHDPQTEDQIGQAAAKMTIQVAA